MSYVEEETRDIKNIFNRIRKKDFSGTTGQIMKNSTYNLSTSLIAKFGSMLFTIVIARMLGAELFGLYTLALSTIILFSIFSDLGISAAMITFVSKSLGKNNPEKAKTYFKGLLKYKVYLIAASSLILITAGYLLSTLYYTNKPIYLALLAGALYIPILQISGYINTAFQAGNNFKAGMIKEIIFQVSRFSLVPLSIFYLLKTNSPNSITVATIILTLTGCYFLSLLYLRIIAKKKIIFLRKKAAKLKKQEKAELKKFILPLTFTALSGTFFGFIDTLMLGHYVDSIHIGYYGSAFALVGSASALLSFISGAVLPTFSRKKGKSLEKIFNKTRGATILIGIPGIIFTVLFARYILLIYGREFIPATPLLQLFSIILIITPIAGIYNAYFTSIKETKIIAKLLIISTLVNIILNICFITYGLQFSMLFGVIGACLATISSRTFYLLGLVLYKKKLSKNSK